MIPTDWAVLLAAGLFSIGVLGLLRNRSALRVLVSVELILNAANLNFVAFANHHGSTDGLAFALFSIALAAAEAAIGLAVLIHLYRHLHSVNVDKATALRW